mmetsp:Transcript_9280/g.25242  ORF Transcript_9280/g.25242 Transcript_9280/m.25242 type:complete len:160 (-) Transcript_9280:209-688(-)|eukprot:CAMPEP_0113917104 /NCGR_PEP_ID=MMETSP0780_2-20120614/32524_1 /TAXON_ID=652834 /ORGANISM="Palpitomonas bilix" /LENGTH=159 /DNA_ID=CAMNT_0000916591 /DNA_START=18 /DNA_END=497 /DNA_ORIENTATION=- /assembly_acc=CAM_ASM_000599
MIEIPAEYGYCLLVVTLMAFQCMTEGIWVGAARKKHFGKHKVPNNGYPDTGLGRLTKDFSDAEWHDFNNAMRVHQNYVEGIAPASIFVLVSGLFFPTLSASAGVVYFIGRVIYGIGYRKYGASGRIVGAAIFDLAILVLFFSAVNGAVRSTGLLASFGL